jgi:hypothetical protein
MGQKEEPGCVGSDAGDRLDADVILRNQAIVEVQPTIFLYRPAGDFLRDGKPANDRDRAAIGDHEASSQCCAVSALCR